MRPPNNDDLELEDRSANTSSRTSVSKPDTADTRMSSEHAGSDAEKAARPAGPPPKPIFIALFMNGMMLVALMWILSSLLNGKMHGRDEYSDRIQVLAVDMDGSRIGSSLLETTGSLNSVPGQPTWLSVFHNENTTYDSIREKVRDESDVWGAIIANTNATSRLMNALRNTTEADPESSPDPYRSDQAITLIFNEARYPNIELSLIYSNMLAAIQRLQVNFQRTEGMQNLMLLPANATMSNKMALLSPIGFHVDNIKEFAHANAFLANTVMTVFPIISQFFFLMGVNGILTQSGAYKAWSVKKHLFIRAVCSTVYPFIIGFSWAGWIFIWRNNTELSGKQYILSALLMWLFCMVHFHIIDGVLAHIQPRWIPFFIFTWVIMQTTATIAPIQLANQFYRYEYVLPTHHSWDVMMSIFSDGAAWRGYYNLPVLCVWYLLALVWNTWGQIKRATRFQRAP